MASGLILSLPVGSRIDVRPLVISRLIVSMLAISRLVMSVRMESILIMSMPITKRLMASIPVVSIAGSREGFRRWLRGRGSIRLRLWQFARGQMLGALRP
jgi:hypothetical protein